MPTETAMLDVGAEAPDFEGVTQTGESVKLSDFRGKKVALYFYPKDGTPGCTKQACSLRDGYDALQDAGIAVLGVSVDPVESHTKFAEKHQLPFPLIADPDREVLTKYGVWGDRSLYGRIFKGTHRTTFLIDEDGKVVDVIRKPKVGEHAAEVLRRFA